ncbi:MAG: class I SAM-dependent rRNA methyltransferase [Planctomycetota bacterium]|nr:class I SAM-dependent rRNA methyltransferase [Planctomycetota bacterium]
MRTVTLQPGRAKPAWMGHPWIFADSVAQVDAGGDEDDWVQVVDADGRTLGAGFFSPDSAFAVRLLTRGDPSADADEILRTRLGAAVALRQRLFPDPTHTNAYRLVHADGDGLPGLVVDRLADVLVAQFGIGATHRRRQLIAAFLLEATGARCLVSRPGGYEREERIDYSDLLVGPAPDADVAIVECGMALEAAPRSGQKTGHYVDQRENRRLVGELASGLDVLDLYAGTGGFAVQCLRHGARSALAIDASERAMAAATRHGVLNGVGARLEARTADATVELAALRAARTQYGLVVVDPPNFFPKRGKDRGALKLHRELNVRALSRVAPGGFLASFSCSARLDETSLLEMLRSAARECRRPFRVLRSFGAGPDHPVASGLPEGRYLTGFLLQVDDTP